MNQQERNRKRTMLRYALMAALVMETLLVGGIIMSIFRDDLVVSNWQLIVFFMLLVWIYFAYLKQRALLMSVSVVDEKIKTHALVAALADGVILLDAHNQVLILNQVASDLTGLSELDLLGHDLADTVGTKAGTILKSGGEGETEDEVGKTGRRIRISVKRMDAKNPENSIKVVYVRPPEVRAETGVAGAGAEGCAGMLGVVAEVIPLLAGSPGLALRLMAQAQLLEHGGLLRALCTARASVPLGKQRVEWRSLVNEVLARVSPLATAAGVALDLSKVAAESVMADPLLIRAAVTQVMVNAVLDSIPGGRTVTVQSATMGPNACLAVTDTGPAVPRQNIHALYAEPYTGLTGDDGKTLRKDGTGLLLTRRIIEAHAGTLLAESPPKGGLRVVIMLPSASG